MNLVEHASYCSGAAIHGPAIRIGPKTRVLQFASYTFDASLLETLTTLMFGGCSCVPSEYDRLNNITNFINEKKVDLALLTPSFVQLLSPSAVPNLKTLILAGEAMSKSHLDKWADKVDLVNAYGPTECSVVATANGKMTPTTNPANLGRGIDRCWIVDAHNHDRLVPIGTIGELLVEGPTLSRGYLKNTKKTSEVFIENPKWATNSYHTNGGSVRRMYKTGDLVRYSPDGSFDMIFLGRKDTQAKVRGQRLELDEVEHHLIADPAIQHVLVTIPSTGQSAKKLVAILSLQDFSGNEDPTSNIELVTSKEATSKIPSIRDRLRNRVPIYMIPSQWIILRKLPLLPSGKLDRRQATKFVEQSDEAKLRESAEDEQKALSNREVRIDSLTTVNIEEQLQNVWSHVLNLPAEQVDLNSSFLHLVRFETERIH